VAHVRGFGSRLALVTALLVGLSVGVPAGAIPSGGGFPLSWLRSLVSERAAWALSSAFTGVPIQRGGPNVGLSGYVSADATRADGGSGRAAHKVAGGLDGFRQRDPGAAVSATVSGAAGFDARTSRRDAAQSSAGVDRFTNADGSVTKRVYDTRVNYQATDGTWQPIDSNLVPDTQGRWAMRANSLQLSLAGADGIGAAQQTGRAGSLVSVTLPTGETISYRLASGSFGAPDVTGSTATYRSVLAQTDLELQTFADGVKETLVLNSPDAPSSWTFPLTLSGLTPRLAEDGSIELTNTAGAVVARFPPGSMSDSSFDPAIGDSAHSSAVTYALTTAGGQPALQVTADSAWLHDPARVFPVRVDPTISTFTDGDVYVDNDPSTGAAEQNGDNLPVGTLNGTIIARSFVAFDHFDEDQMMGKKITAASLKLYHTWSFDCTHHLPVNVSAITQNWQVTTLSTSGLPGPTTSAPIGSLTVADNNPACTNTTNNRSIGAWVSVPLDVTTLNNWSGGISTNFGLALTASETDKTASKRFTSANYSSGTYKPYLQLTYSANVAPQVDTRYPANNAVVQTLTPQLVSRAHDPDAFPATPLKYRYDVFDATGVTSLANSGWITTPVWTVPPGALKWNNTYLYTVQVYDTVTYSSISPMYAFSTPVPQPTLTSGLAQNPGKGYDPSTGNYTTSATDASIAGVGPALEVTRSYNSLNRATDTAFGMGWTSIMDMRAAQNKDVAGAVQTVIVRYPNGQEVAFGRNADGTFTPPSGRYAVLSAVLAGDNVTVIGYTLTDKDATVYTFTQADGTGTWKIKTIKDGNGRTESFGYDGSGNLATITSAAGRVLHVEWVTPAGATRPYVSKVYTDRAVITDPLTVQTWTYTVDGSAQLLSVCAPASAGGCTTYQYQTTSQGPNYVLNNGPYSYWRLNEAAGPVAKSAVLANAGVDNGLYNNVTLGGSALYNTTSTSSTFNGTNAFVQLPGKLVADGAYQSVSMWFKTTTVGGVLFSYSLSPITAGTTSVNYVPALYIDSSGYLRGEFFAPNTVPIKSLAPVTDGGWHHVVLSGAGSTQSMYLDGAAQGAPLSGAIALYANGSSNEYVGAGFIGGYWPDHPNTGRSPAPAAYFTGQISDVAFFNRGITATDVTSIYNAARYPASSLSKITRPSGKATATVTYDTVTGWVKQLVDENGGSWTLGTPTVAGSSDVYEAAVLGSKPRDYWRLQDPAGNSDAVNEVNGDTASYSGTLTFGSNGPFADSKAVTFDGTSSALQLPVLDIPTATATPASIGLWFKTTTATGGVLAGFQANALGVGGDPNYLPALYVGVDGKLRGTFCYCGGAAPMTSATAVNDGKWHAAVLTRATTGQTLYLDGVQIGTKSTSTTETRTMNYGYIGAGVVSTNWPSKPTNNNGYLSGSVAEAAFYPTELTANSVQAQFDASKQTTPVAITTVDTTVQNLPMPVKVVTVTDPGGKTISYSYDIVDGNRLVAETDALSNTTRYGYDTGGFDNLVYDPNGVRTQTVQDARGNTIQQITCQDQSANKCSSVYYEYYLNAANPTDPRNDLMTTTRDGRSTSATDNQFKTTTDYDSAGNPTTVTDPLGRQTVTAYTDGTTVSAVDGGYAPPGLPASITNDLGAVQKIEYYGNGDVARVTTPAGKVTSYTYDNLGRKLTEKDVTDTFPSGRTTTFSYDGLARVLTQTDPPVTNRVTGAVHTAQTSNVYDADGNMTSQTIADLTGGDVTRTETVTFNAYGQKQTQTDALNKATSFSYDLYGRVVRETGADGGQTKYDVDAEGNVLKVWALGFTGDPNNPTAPTDTVLQTKQFDPAGRLATETDAMGWTTSYIYTDNGLPVKVTRSDGTTSFVVEENSYDAAGNLTKKVTNNGATATTYDYDNAGRQYRTTVDKDGLNRITTNVLSSDDQVLSTTATDGSGATLARTDMLYDPEGRLLAQTGYNGDPATAPTAWWKLNQTSGTNAADASGNNAAPLAGGYTWSSEHGGSIALDGTGTASAAGPVLDTTRSFTVAAWVKLTDNGGDRTVVTQEGKNLSAFYLEYSKFTDRWNFDVPTADGAGASWPDAASNTPPTLNTWTHLAGVYDSTAKTLRLYVNGVAQNDVASGITLWRGLGKLDIGHAFGGAGFRGNLSDVQVYQTALTATQVTAIKDGTAPTGTVSRTSYQVDNDGLALSTTDPNGNTTDIGYDEADRPAVSTGAAVTAETFAGTVTARPVTFIGYDTFGDQTETVDGNGNRTVHVFDRNGREYETHLPAYTPPGSSTPITPVTSRVFDDLNQVTSATDANGKITSYVYDQLGRVAKVTNPGGGSTTATYDLLGDQLSSTDPTGAVAQTTYDYLGRQVDSTQLVRQDSSTRITKYTYDTAGRLKDATSPGGVKQSYLYNAAGETTKVTDGAGKDTSYGYDGLGRQIKVTAPDSTYSTTGYDMLGRVTGTASYPTAGGTALTSTVRSYDRAGNLVSFIDGRQAETKYTYDPTGMVLSESQPTGATPILTTFGYDLAGNRTRFTDGRGNPFWTTYNTWNLPESQIEPQTTAYPNVADRTYTTVYDAAGRKVSQVLPGGVTQAYGYNDDGLLTSQTGTGAEAATTARSFGYDLAGRLTSFSSPGASSTVTYDDRGLPLTISGPSGNSTFTYNADGAMASRTDAAGTTGYNYDVAGRLLTVTNNPAGVNLAYGYDLNSAVKTITYGSSNVRTFTYDDLHRVTADELKTSGGTTIGKIGYGWDANGNETSKTATNFSGTTTSNTYTYDLAGRLTSWNNGTNTTSYTYDEAGNRTHIGSRTLSYDNRNRLTTDGTTTYSYTARGTLAQTMTGSGSYTTSADAFGQIISQGAAAGTQTYNYDALGRAIKAGFSYTGLDNDLAADGAATYLRDPAGALIGETTGGTQRLAWTDLHTDVVGQFTATGTTLTGSTTYDPLGRVTASTGMIGNLGYQSEWTEASTGRVNMLARWYNSDTGQFDTRDSYANNPIPASIGANQYQYGDANPLTVTDPSGHCSFYDLVCNAKTAYHATTSAIHTVSHAATSAAVSMYNWGASAYRGGVSTLSNARRAAADLVDKGWNTVKTTAHKVAKVVKKTVNAGRKLYNQGAQALKQKAKQTWSKVKQAGHIVKAKATRVVTKAVKNIKDGYHATTKFVADHKAQILEVAAVVVTIAATMTLGPVGGILVGVAVNVAKDAAMGNIHSIADLGTSVLTGAVSGAIGAATGGLGGAIGGRLAGAAAAKFGANLFGRVASGALAGGISGGLADAGYQAITKGSVDWRQTAVAAGFGAVTGAIGGGLAKPASQSKAQSLRSCHSFDPATRVLMADGSTKQIKHVKIGDKVVATNPASGTTEAKPVTVLHRNNDGDLADVSVADAKTGKTTVLHTTWHHPFWNATTDQWTDAADLKAGDRLRNADAETAQLVTAVRIWTGLKWMNDLTVADTHTYYVLAGTGSILVHNTDATCDIENNVHRPGCSCDPFRDGTVLDPLNAQNDRYGAIEEVGGIFDQGLEVASSTRGTPGTVAREPGLPAMGDQSPGGTAPSGTAGLIALVAVGKKIADWWKRR
jgi:large repetitive protein